MNAIQQNYEWRGVPIGLARAIGYILTAFGTTLVLSSTYQLGIVGTYLGDYFGILLSERVTGFPFNVTDAPMYYGSTLNFLGIAISYQFLSSLCFRNRSPVGLLLTGLVLIVYLVALRFEEYFAFL